MSYKVRYKKAWWPWWRRLSGVKGDGFYGGLRSFYLETGELHLIPAEGVIFELGPERMTKLRAQAGQARQPLTPYPAQAGGLKLLVAEEAPTPTPTGHMALLLADDRRLELPPSLAVRFSGQRALVIARRMEQETGLPLHLT